MAKNHIGFKFVCGMFTLLLFSLMYMTASQADDGDMKWAFQTGGYIEPSPAIGSDGTVYVGSYDGRLYAIEGSSGGLADTPWPMFHHDLQHTGRSAGQACPAKVATSDTHVLNSPY